MSARQLDRRRSADRRIAQCANAFGKSRPGTCSHPAVRARPPGQRPEARETAQLRWLNSSEFFRIEQGRSEQECDEDSQNQAYDVSDIHSSHFSNPPSAAKNATVSNR